MRKTFKRKGGMPTTRRSSSAVTSSTATARPQSRAAAAREAEARARALIRDYYRPPVIRGDAIDDPEVRYMRDLVTQKIQENPNRREEILNALDNLRRAIYEQDARNSAWEQAQQARERNLPGSDVNTRRPFRQAEEEAANNWTAASRARTNAEQQLDFLLYTQDEINERNAENDAVNRIYEEDNEYGDSDDDMPGIMEVDEEPVDIPAVNIQTDCQTDLNSSGEYISGISLEELAEGQTVKLSDGHCYNNTDIVNYYRDKKTRQLPFISPFNRQPFTQQDINIVKTIMRDLQNALPEQGGYKKHKSRKSKKSKKSKKARKSKK